MACKWQEAFGALVGKIAYDSILLHCTVVVVTSGVMIHNGNVAHALLRATITQTMSSGCVALR